MDVAPWQADLAWLFTFLFGVQVVMLTAATLVGSILYSVSIVTIFVIRNRE